QHAGRFPEGPRSADRKGGGSTEGRSGVAEEDDNGTATAVVVGRWSLVATNDEPRTTNDHGVMCYSIRTMRSVTCGKRSNTGGSWPGTRSCGVLARLFIRSCVRRFEAASSVCEIGVCESRFS